MQRDFLAVRQGPQPRFVYVCVQHTDLLLWSLRLEEIFEPRRGLEGEGKREKGVGRIAADGQISFEKPFVPCVRKHILREPATLSGSIPSFSLRLEGKGRVGSGERSSTDITAPRLFPLPSRHTPFSHMSDCSSLLLLLLARIHLPPSLFALPSGRRKKEKESWGNESEKIISWILDGRTREFSYVRHISPFLPFRPCI